MCDLSKSSGIKGRMYREIFILNQYGLDTESDEHRIHHFLCPYWEFRRRIVRQQHSEVRQQLVAATARRAPLHWLDVTDRVRFKLAVLINVPVSSWNGSAVPGQQLHTNRRRFWSSASAVRQSAEVDRSALSSEQFRSSVFCCRGPVDLEFATWHWQALYTVSSRHFLWNIDEMYSAFFWQCAI